MADSVQWFSLLLQMHSETGTLVGFFKNLSVGIAFKFRVEIKKILVNQLAFIHLENRKF